MKWGQKLIIWKYFYLHIYPEGKAEVATNTATPVTRILSFLSSSSYATFLSMYSVLVLAKVRIISNSLIVYILDMIRLSWMVLIKLQNNSSCCGVHSKSEQLIHSLKLIKI